MHNSPKQDAIKLLLHFPVPFKTAGGEESGEGVRAERVKHNLDMEMDYVKTRGETVQAKIAEVRMCKVKGSE